MEKGGWRLSCAHTPCRPPLGTSGQRDTYLCRRQLQYTHATHTIVHTYIPTLYPTLPDPTLPSYDLHYLPNIHKPSHTYIHTFIHTYMLHGYMYINMEHRLILVFTLAYIHTYTHTDRHTYVQKHRDIQTCIHTYTHPYTHINVYILTYIYMHIHTLIDVDLHRYTFRRACMRINFSRHAGYEPPHICMHCIFLHICMNSTERHAHTP